MLAVQDGDVLPGAQFFAESLSDSTTARSLYFKAFWGALPPDCIVFFDPDNGLEVKSTPKGRKGSAKYLYLDELQTTAQRSLALVVYQHFGRVQRAPYIRSQLARIANLLPHHHLLALSGAHVAFLVAAAPVLAGGVRVAMSDLQARWPDLQLVDLAPEGYLEQVTDAPVGSSPAVRAPFYRSRRRGF
jgi:hypothetical protein